MQAIGDYRRCRARLQSTLSRATGSQVGGRLSPRKISNRILAKLRGDSGLQRGENPRPFASHSSCCLAFADLHAGADERLARWPGRAQRTPRPYPRRTRNPSPSAQDGRIGSWRAVEGSAGPEARAAGGGGQPSSKKAVVTTTDSPDAGPYPRPSSRRGCLPSGIRPRRAEPSRQHPHEAAWTAIGSAPSVIGACGRRSVTLTKGRPVGHPPGP